nr:alpha-2-macroglobulin family protein [Verrucomicrobiales bacterium]
EQHFSWDRAPIETQAMMIEVFREVAGDPKTADDCRVWLLKQRQIQAWPSTKSTADAIYALLLGGSDLLGSDALVTLSLGGKTVEPGKVEGGTGFYEKRYSAAEVQPAMGTVKLTKTDSGVSWGSLHWQYLEDIAKVTPHEGTPLTLKKTLFTKIAGKAGPELKPLAPGEKLKPGGEVVTRVELRTDRDLEFVHLKDQRGSGTEPLNVLSGYRFQDGLSYYESTRDTASHFFIEYLPKGVYVFETSARVQLRGRYESGIAEIQCLYAPEFNSHSSSFPLEVE